MVKTIILKFDEKWFEAFKEKKEQTKAKSWEAFFMEQIFNVTDHSFLENRGISKKKAEAPHA